MAGPLDPAVLPHLRPARTTLAMSVIAGVVAGLATVAQAFAVGALIVRLVTDTTGDSWHEPAYWLLAVTSLRAGAAWAMDACTSRAAAQVTGTLRRRLGEKIVAGQLSNSAAGSVTVLATRGLHAIEPYLTRYLPSLVLAVVLPVATVIAIAALDWLSALIVVLTLPLVPAFAILIGLATQTQASREWRQMSALAGHFLDVVRGLPTLVANRRAAAQSHRIREITDEHRRRTLATLRTAFASSVALELIATLSVALVAVCVGLRLAQGNVGFETALVVLLLAPEAYWPLRRVGAEFHAAAEGTAAFAELDTELTSAAAAPGGHAAPVGHRLRLEAASFTHPGRTISSLDAVSYTFPARGLVAISGPSGCGKTTLLTLLTGERTPTSGRVIISDAQREQDLHDVSLEAWREVVARAPQRPWLVADTIAANLRLAVPTATLEQLWRALEAVGLAEVVAELPDGITTTLDEDGSGLSAGQRARLALARVVLADRPILILDEPSAHLDAATEAVLLDTLRRLARERLVITVAHREAVLRAADEVLELTAPARSGTNASQTAPLTLEADRAAETQQNHSPAAAEKDQAPLRWGQRTATLLGTLSTASGVALTATAAWLITRSSEHPPVMYLMVAIVGVRLFGIARPVLRYAERLVSHDDALRMLAERRAQIFDALVPLTPGAIGRRRGDLLTSVVDDVDALVDQRLRVRQPLVTGVWVGLGAALVAGLLDPFAGLVCLALLAVTGGIALGCRALTRTTETGWVTARAAVAREVEHLAHNANELRAWGADSAAMATLDRHSDELARRAARANRITATGHLLVTLAASAALVLIAALAGDGGLSPALLALVTMLPLGLVDANTAMVDAAVLSVRTETAAARVESLTRLTPAVAEPGHDRQSVPVPIAPLHARGLSAHWPNAGQHRAVDLGSLHLDVGEGTRVGVVGPSGSGKSTLVALLLRFLDPAGGELTWHGVPATNLAGDDLRAHVGWVDDDPYLFSSSVLENVRLARPESSDGEVLHALARAGLGAWVAQLPEGIDTLIGEGNLSVSGGERARVAIARALLANHQVLVLDEPTAHLDTDTANQVSRQLLDQVQTCVWITHGTVGLDQMDQVLSLSAHGVLTS